MQTKLRLIEAYTHSKEGYNPYLIGPKWQVAQLNFQPDLAPEAIKKIDGATNSQWVSKQYGGKTRFRD